MEKYYSNSKCLIIKVTVISPANLAFVIIICVLLMEKKTLAESVEALNRCEARLFF